MKYTRIFNLLWLLTTDPRNSLGVSPLMHLAFVREISRDYSGNLLRFAVGASKEDYEDKAKTVEITRSLLAQPGFNLAMMEFGQICRFGELPVISWFLSQDLEPLSKRHLDHLLFECCRLGPRNSPRLWNEIVTQILNCGVNIHQNLASERGLECESHAHSLLHVFLREHEDTAPWLKVLGDFGIDLEQYAKEEEEIHQFNHQVHVCKGYKGGKTGIYHVKYIYPRSTEEDVVQIRLGSLVDWETAFRENHSGPEYDTNLFSLKYLFEGFVDAYDLEIEEWGPYEQEQTQTEKVYHLLSDYKVWLYWITISLILHTYFHWWILPWVSRIFGY
jgi:hypothetical protein